MNDRRRIQSDLPHWVSSIDGETKRQLLAEDRPSMLYRCKWCGKVFDIEREAEKHATACGMTFEVKHGRT